MDTTIGPYAKRLFDDIDWDNVDEWRARLMQHFALDWLVRAEQKACDLEMEYRRVLRMLRAGSIGEAGE